MAHPKIIAVVRKLAKATRRAAADWKETEDDGVFQVSFPESSIRIGIRQGHVSGADEYFIAIFNSQGDLVEEIGDEDGESEEERVMLFSELKETYESARGRAKGVDQVLDEILRELDGDIPF